MSALFSRASETEIPELFRRASETEIPALFRRASIYIYLNFVFGRQILIYQLKFYLSRLGIINY